MKQKDITEKMLEDYNDVFADIVNVVLFDGKQLVHPDELFAANTKSQYKADDGRLHELDRDNAKKWQKRNVTFSMFGLENQSAFEKNMPLRVFGYEGEAYRSQLLGKTPHSTYPVVTLVLNFGDKPWNQSQKTLKDVIDVPEELEPYMNDIKLNVCDVAWLEEEKIEKFQSDFGIVADFFVQMRKTGEYKSSEKEMQHVDEVLKLLSVFTGSAEYEELVRTGATKGVNTMCEMTKKIKEAGRSEGRKEGVVIGRKEGRNDAYYEFIQRGRISIEEAAEELHVTEEEIISQMKMMGYRLPKSV